MSSLQSWLLVFTLGSKIIGRDAEGQVVDTRYGEVLGESQLSFFGGHYTAFKGIPYARAPLGDLRFRPPQPPLKWSGILDATQHRSICIQYIDLTPDANTTIGSEDCLFLNVYTPLLPSAGCERKLLPVIVFIHGGGFTVGNGDSDLYAPDYLMDHEVVLVTLNYRLNVFGFFTTSDSAAPGNYGLMDQSMALRWVRDNIASFGGDPARVTLVGQSAGGASVGLHVLSPQSRGLFTAAISQSGASMCKFAASGRNQVPALQEHARLLGCSHESSLELADCFRSKTAEQLMDTQAQILRRNPVDLLNMLYQPRVDGGDNADSFLPEDPHTTLELGNFSKVPWINGIVRDEAAAMASIFALNPIARDTYQEKDFSLWAERILGLAEVTTNPAAVAEAIYNYYCRIPESCEGELYFMRQLVKMLSDRINNVCTSVEIELASSHTSVYRYLMDFDGPGRIDSVRTGLGNRTQFNLGVAHGEDLFYIFRPAISPSVDPDSDTYRMIQFMTSLWVNFAATGVPSFSGREVDFPDWPTYSADRCGGQVMRLNLYPSVSEDTLKTRVQFWKQLDIKETWRHPQTGH